MSGLVRYNPPSPPHVIPDLGWDYGQSAAGQTVLSAAAFTRMIRSLWRRKFRFALIFLLLLLPTAYFILRLPASFTADAMLVLRLREPPHIDDLQPAPGAAGLSSESGLNLVRSELQILTSKELAQRVVADMHLDEESAKDSDVSPLQTLTAYIRAKLAPVSQNKPPDSAMRLEEAISAYRKHFTAFNDGKSFVIGVTFTANSPALAKAVLAHHLKLYLADQVTEKEAAIDSVRSWLDVELTQLADKVQNSEQQLQQFRGNHNLLRSGGETIVSHQSDELVAQLGRSRADLLMKQARLQDIQNVSRGSVDAAMLASPVIQRGRDQEAALTARIAELRERYSSDYPTVKSTSAALDATRQSIAGEISRMARAAQNDVNVASANVQGLQQEVNGLNQAAGASELTDLSQAQLQRETDANRQLYNDLLRRSKQFEIQRQVQHEPDARLASQPSASLTPSSTRHLLLLGVSGGAFAVLTAGIILFLDRHHLQSRSLHQIEATCRVFGLTSVPLVRSLRHGRGSFPAQADSRSVFALSLQTLRNSLAFHAGGGQPQAIAFTSALPGEGKTFLAAFYARSLASAGLRVLLIDADLRQSGLAHMFKVKPDVGVESALAGSAGLKDCIRRITGFNFDVLLSETGYENPQDLLGSAAFTRLIDQARTLYDAIIIDTPPIAAVDDALPVAKATDATVLVVRWGETPHEVIRGAVKRLQLGGGRVTGAVLNAVDMGEYQSSSQDLEAYRPLRSSYITYQR